MTRNLTSFNLWGSFLSLTNKAAFALFGGALTTILFNILHLNGILLVWIILNLVFHMILKKHPLVFLLALYHFILFIIIM